LSTSGAACAQNGEYNDRTRVLQAVHASHPVATPEQGEDTQRTNIARRATGGLHHLLLIDNLGKAKIGYFDFRVVGDALDEEILGLQRDNRTAEKTLMSGQLPPPPQQQIFGKKRKNE
jgi:hypothetical protein